TTSGRAILNVLNFNKSMDKATTKLMEYCATGKHIPKAEIHFCQAGEGDKKHVYMKYTLENVVLASYQVGAGGDYRPTENVSMVYETIESGYKDLDNKGGAGAELKFKYSASENKKV
ncbi:MAG: type VI secretion system tube protein Hcp, partial [Thiolinea sp.]